MPCKFLLDIAVEKYLESDYAWTKQKLTPKLRKRANFFFFYVCILCKSKFNVDDWNARNTD